MSVSKHFRMTEANEKTLEFNVLNELASYLWKFGLAITVISPTQVDESRCGCLPVSLGALERPKEEGRFSARIRYSLLNK